MPLLNSFETCSSCPNRKNGFCVTMLNILGQDLEPQIIKRKIVEEKQRLICQGSHNEGPCILQSGWLMLTRVDDNGKRQVLKLVLPGEVFGFQPDIHGPAIYSAVTLTDCVICIIPSAFQLCSTHPELAMRLAWVSSSDLLLLELYLEKISQHRATERVAFMVLELYRRLKQRNMVHGNSFQFPLRQEDIGDFLGLTN